MSHLKGVLFTVVLSFFLHSIHASEMNGLSATYYDNQDFTGPELRRIDSVINYNWGKGSPDAAMGVDAFSARWTGQVIAQFTETYTFYTQSDDGVRLWVDGRLIVDKWIAQSRTEWSATIDLVAGRKYDIRLEYYEAGGDACVALLWSSLSLPKAVIPTSNLFPFGDAFFIGTGNGVTAQVYPSATLSSLASPFNVPAGVQNFPFINFNLASTESLIPQVSHDYFSVRFLGELEPQASETYTFYLTGDDGIRLWIDGKLLVDAWKAQSPTLYTATIELKARKKVSLQLDYFQNAGQAVARLEWSSPSTPRAVVPTSQLYSETGITTVDVLESQVSPVCVEGNAWNPQSAAPFVITANDIAAQLISDVQWFANVPLNQNASTRITVRNSTTGGQSILNTKWVPTDITGKVQSSDPVVIRKGDALLLTARSANASDALQISPDGAATISGVSGRNYAFTYAQAGEFVATASVNGVVVGTQLIYVVDVDYQGSIACQVGYTRAKNVSVAPVSAVQSVFVTTADLGALQTATSATSPDGVSLTLKPLHRGSPKLVSRLGSARGPVISVKNVDEFTTYNPAKLTLFIDANGVATGTLKIFPHIPCLEARLSMFAHRCVFANGTKNLVANTDSFQILSNELLNETLGLFEYQIIVPADENGSCFHTQFFQAGIPISFPE